MALLTCADLPVVSGEVELPAGGAWHALLRLDADAPPSGRVALRWGGSSALWQGTIARAGVLAPGGPVEVRVVGGRGGLGRTVPGASYRRATVRVILGHLLEAAGEVQASLASALLSRVLPRWTRAEGPAGAQLDSLAWALGVVWRVLPSGGVWMGGAPTGAISLPADAEITRRLPTEGRIELALGEPWSLAPGGLFEGQRVASVAIEIGPSRVRGALCLS